MSERHIRDKCKYICQIYRCCNTCPNPPPFGGYQICDMHKEELERYKSEKCCCCKYPTEKSPLLWELKISKCSRHKIEALRLKKRKINEKIKRLNKKQ